MKILLLMNVFAILVVLGKRVIDETDDLENFKAVMQKLFIEELGEDLRRKLESISNEGVVLNKTNEEINDMVEARLNKEEMKRMKNAFQAIVGPAKKMASQRVKGRKVTRSSQYKPTTPKPSQKPKSRGANKNDKTSGKSATKNYGKIEL